MAAVLAQAALWNEALTSQLRTWLEAEGGMASRSGFCDEVLAMVALCLLSLSFNSCFDHVFRCSLMIIIGAMCIFFSGRYVK